MKLKPPRPTVLKHIHIPSPTTYHSASKLQDTLVRSFLSHKANPTTTPPSPTIISFSPSPIYTTGRRDISKPISPEQHQLLTRPLQDLTCPDKYQTAEVFAASRGGQITFHGPGQLVLYPILDLLSLSLSPRCYVSLLETITIRTLSHYGISTVRTEDPGVWLERDRTKKIAALGVHLRRNVSSHGVGLNVSTDLRWFKRIVACGLEGKGVESMVNELREQGEVVESLEGEEGVVKVGKVWVEEFVKELGMAVERERYELPKDVNEIDGVD